MTNSKVFNVLDTFNKMQMPKSLNIKVIFNQNSFKLRVFSVFLIISVIFSIMCADLVKSTIHYHE